MHKHQAPFWTSNNTKFFLRWETTHFLKCTEKHYWTENSRIPCSILDLTKHQITFLTILMAIQSFSKFHQTPSDLSSFFAWLERNFFFAVVGRNESLIEKDPSQINYCKFCCQYILDNIFLMFRTVKNIKNIHFLII